MTSSALGKNLCIWSVFVWGSDSKGAHFQHEHSKAKGRVRSGHVSAREKTNEFLGFTTRRRERGIFDFHDIGVRWSWHELNDCSWIIVTLLSHPHPHLSHVVTFIFSFAFWARSCSISTFESSYLLSCIMPDFAKQSIYVPPLLRDVLSH